MQQTISIVVSGKVQGVYFRHETKENALALGLTGKVSNLPDGTVHIIATGPIESLDLFTAWCRQGPPTATVTGVVIKNLPLMVFDKFMIERFSQNLN
jgi:acylphosphatase